MEAKIVWTKRVVEDMYEIRQKYVQSAHYADWLTNKFFEKGDLLVTFPKMGRMVPEIENPLIREVLIDSYRMIYSLSTTDEVRILTIHSGGSPITTRMISE